MKIQPPLFGLESELRFEAFLPDGTRDHRALDEVERICCEDVPHLAGGERGVFLGNGGNWYREAAGGHTHQEFSTPECAHPTDAVLYSQAGYSLARRGAERFTERTGRRAAFSRSNVCYAERSSWGNHECYCTRQQPAELADSICSHLASRICYSGSGGFDAKSPGLRFVLSGRAAFIHALRSAGTEGANRALFHEDCKSPRGHGGFFRMHLICGDGLCSERALWLRTAATALMVSVADAGFKPRSAACLADPVAALHAFNTDPRLSATALCGDGVHRTAVEVQRECLAHVERHLEFIPAPWAPEAVMEWRRVLDALAGGGPAALARSHDWAIKWDLYSHCLAEQGSEWADFATTDCTGRPDKDEAKRKLRPKMLLLDTQFAQLDASGLFESLDAAPGLLGHRIHGIRERTEWAVSHPPSDTRAAARGAVIRQFSGTKSGGRMRVGWSGVSDGTGNLRLDLSNPFDPSPKGFEEFLSLAPTSLDESPPPARLSPRRFLGL